MSLNLFPSPPLLPTLITQIFSRTLVSGCDRARVFAWAVVNAIYNGNSDDPDDDPMIGSRSSDSNCYSLEFQGQMFEHHRNLEASVQLLAEVAHSPFPQI